MIRVRQLIPFLNAKALIQDKKIPDIWKNEAKKSEFPEWVIKSKKYSDFGIMMEKETIEKMKNDAIDEHIVLMNSMTKWSFSIELREDLLIGHPDLYSQTAVGDIKTTSDFDKNMRIETILQVCCYAFLSKCKYICVLLPLQKQILWHELKEKELDDFRWLCMNSIHILLFDNPLNTKVGYHVSKKNFLTETNSNIPLQVFLGSPRSRNIGKWTEADIQKWNIKCKSQPVWVHASYIALLSNKQEWLIENCVKQIELTKKIGARGIVFHIGSGSEKQLMSNLKSFEPFLSKDCKLILETSCGEGDEILSNPMDLLEFYLGLDNTKFGLCVDTCHVFSAGYSPMETIEMFELASPGSVQLIHYNNSAHCKGNKRDVHSKCGWISRQEMSNIAIFCNKNKISMVVE